MTTYRVCDKCEKGCPGCLDVTIEATGTTIVDVNNAQNKMTISTQDWNSLVKDIKEGKIQ